MAMNGMTTTNERKTSSLHLIVVFGLILYGGLSIVLQSSLLRLEEQMVQVEEKLTQRNDNSVVLQLQELQHLLLEQQQQIIKHAEQKSTPIAESKEEPQPQTQQERLQCLGLGFEEEMDTLLSRYKQVFVLMPCKAAGSTMKAFTEQCMQTTNTTTYVQVDNIFSSNSKPDRVKAFESQLELPSLVTSHMQTSEKLCNVVKHATKESLIIYIHREETSRLASAIKQVITRNRHSQTGRCTKNRCISAEETIFDLMNLEKSTEITWGQHQLLTCDTYDCIKDNRPNMVFVHYKQASKLQKLLAKHHCPSVQTEVRENIATDKRSHSVLMKPSNETLQELVENLPRMQQLKHSGALVDLDAWVDAKIQHIEQFFNMKQYASCVGTTRDLEDDLLSCPDEALHLSGRALDHQRLLFPF